MLVVAALVVFTACDPAEPESASGGGDDLTAAMCAAVEAAEAGDLGDARDLFEDNHAGLHALADAVADTDRQRAGELLRAKQEVESVISRASADRLEGLLRSLAVATARAAGGDPPNCA